MIWYNIRLDSLIITTYNGIKGPHISIHKLLLVSWTEADEERSKRGVVVFRRDLLTVNTDPGFCFYMPVHVSSLGWTRHSRDKDPDAFTFTSLCAISGCTNICRWSVSCYDDGFIAWFSIHIETMRSRGTIVVRFLWWTILGWTILG